MPHSIRVATIQMDGSPASQSERLQRAAHLIKQAAETGAEFIILPAFFNTGVTYLETNYEKTERLSDESLQWLRVEAQTHGIYLAGSLMLVDLDDTFHAAFLIAPDGQIWRYDQQYPLLWERAFYRDGHGLTVADTPIGKIGMLIGWDASHAELWERYAAKVDLMLVMSAQCIWEDGELIYPDGKHYSLQSANPITRWIAPGLSNDLQDTLAKQAKWLGVPVICAGMSGVLLSILPAPRFSAALLSPWDQDGWERYSRDYPDAQISVPFVPITQIIGADGTQTQISETGDAIITQEITLSEHLPLPRGKQPAIKITKASYWLVDVFAAGLLSMTYRRGIRRQWGARMAPRDPNTPIWLQITMAAALLGWLIGFIFRGKRRS